MGYKFLLAVIGSVLLSATAVSQGWEFSGDEVLAIRSGTLRYAIEKPGYLMLDMCSDVDGEFDRLEVIALKNAKNQPDLPYRIKLFKDGGVRETSVIPHKSLTSKTAAEMLFLDQNPFPGLLDLGDAGDEGKAVSDGIARVDDKDGRRNVTLQSLCSDDRLIVLNVSGDGDECFISSLGTRRVPPWPIYEGGLLLRGGHSELMKSDTRFLKFLATQKYICSWAMYKAGESESGWIESPTGKEHPFVLRVRVWKAEEVRLTRANALCIVRVSGCAKMNGTDSFKIDCEKGGKDFSLKMLPGSLGETSRTMRLQYKNAQSSEYISADMSIGEAGKRAEKFKEECKKRVEAKTGKPVK